MTSGRVRVLVEASDPVSAMGISGELRLRADVQVLDPIDHLLSDVTVLVSDDVDNITVTRIRSLHRDGCARVVLVVTRLEDSGLLAAVESGACGILRRSEANSERIAEAVITAARGDGSVPPDLLGRLLSQVSRLQRQVLAPRGLSLNGFTEREVDVLKLLAEGWDTSEIATKLSYSERTVKNVIHDITARLQLRNRAHAVAYALRSGVI
ncbi:MAG TPA: response regulator transcription factor [Acidimicrobiales bacterium]|nr:response regulator transcription factor [Acidimicrobiales bacterium]